MNTAEQQQPLPQDGNVLGAAAVPVQGAPQLPPQMFTTAAQLLDLTDKKLMLVLRDGRKLIGVLRTWDQFANLVLTDTKERYYVETEEGDDAPPRRLFCDIPRGTYLVRGENVLLLGEIDLDRDEETPPGYVEGQIEEVFGIQKRQEMERKKSDQSKLRRFGDLESSGEVLF